MISHPHERHTPYWPASSRTSASLIRVSVCAHLEQRELDVALDVGVRRVDVIADVVALIDSPATDPILHVVLQFARRS